jgi:histidyl-tRNA synthetase
MNKPSLPKGTRDFGPDIMVRRNYIFRTIRQAFERYGFKPVETPAMENLDTLTGKYGDEGDQLIFKILNNGDYLKSASGEILDARDSRSLVPQICDRALRYDLTVPFARFVVMNQHAISFPFRRYQVQPVWRADRPQKGRYREFYQCDADIIGTDSLLGEVELVQLYDDALTALGLPSFAIRINNRKILAGIAEVAGIGDRMTEMTVAIDKLDKIGLSGVRDELKERGFSDAAINRVAGFFDLPEGNEARMNHLRSSLASSATGLKGVEELEYVLHRASLQGRGRIEVDVTLARGLNYYTGAILEVKADGVQIGSIGGGGRYDDLTGIFGLPGMSGVGISFGADRIYDVMHELNLFPPDAQQSTRLLFAQFSGSAGEEQLLLRFLRDARNSGIPSEIYPEAAKLKKQFKYADDNHIPFVAMIGEDELREGKIALKDMATGEQRLCAQGEFTEIIRSLAGSGN